MTDPMPTLHVVYDHGPDGLYVYGVALTPAGRTPYRFCASCDTALTPDRMVLVIEDVDAEGPNAAHVECVVGDTTATLTHLTDDEVLALTTTGKRERVA